MSNKKVLCHHCYSDDYKKNGSTDNVQRYFCNRCRRTFSSNGERFDKSVKEQALQMYLNNVGIRKIALFLKVSPAGVLKWIKKAGQDLSFRLDIASNRMKSDLPDIIELDEIYSYVKKNSKGLSSGLLILGDKVVLFPILSEKE